MSRFKDNEYLVNGSGFSVGPYSICLEFASFGNLSEFIKSNPTTEKDQIIICEKIGYFFYFFILFLNFIFNFFFFFFFFFYFKF